MGVATRARYEIVVWRFEEAPQKIRLRGGIPRPHPPLRPVNCGEGHAYSVPGCISFGPRAINRSGRSEGADEVVSWILGADARSERVGLEGVPCRGPYLLGRFSEAIDQGLVAGPSGHADCGSAWSREGTPSSPARRSSLASI